VHFEQVETVSHRQTVANDAMGVEINADTRLVGCVFVRENETVLMGSDNVLAADVFHVSEDDVFPVFPGFAELVEADLLPAGAFPVEGGRGSEFSA
jgi:hypothetical protein